MISLDLLEGRSTPEPNTGCWLWTGALTSAGYGHCRVEGHYVYAHQLACEAAHGARPVGAVVLHRCDTPACCNPRHVRWGSHAENMADMAQKRRSNRPAGGGNPNVRLTAAQVEEIRRRSVNESGPELAREFGVHRYTVWQIANGRRWSRAVNS